MKAFKNFNRSYAQHSPNRTKLLSELSEFLAWTPEQFTVHNVPDNLNIVDFFRNLNEILLTDEANCDFHWAVFKVIDIASNNSETCRYLVDTVRIITGVANYAVNGSSSLIVDKQIQLWTLVERITTGMVIITEEPHLTNLINHLVASVKRPSAIEEIKLLQVSILTNLCFKNEVAVACLLRFTKSKDLLGAIAGYIVYWGKMSMALARFDSSMLEFELHINMKMIFAVEHFSALMRNNDQRLLRNILDMLVVGFERDEHSRQTLQHFDFKECIEAALTLIDESEINFGNFELMSVFLGIINSILSVSNTTLESSLSRLSKLIIDNTKATGILSEAIKTIRLIAPAATDPQHLTTFISLLIENIQSLQNNLPVATEVYQLLLELYAKCPEFVTQLPQGIISKSIDTDAWSYKVTDVNLSMQIRRLQWLLSFTDANNDDILRRKVGVIMNTKDVHHILASGLKSSDEEICALTMGLVKSQHFPIQSVSKIMSGSFTPNVPKSELDCPSPPVEIVRPFFSELIETRLNDEVDRLELRTVNSKIEMNDYVSMLKYQNIVGDAKQVNLQTQIKTLSDLNTLQSNEIGGLRLAIRNCLNKISELESKLENSQKYKSSMTAAFDTIKMKYDNQTTKYNDLTKKYGVLRSETKRVEATLNQQLSDLKSQYDKDCETHAANVAQLKKDHDREKSDLEERHGKKLEELAEKHKQKEKQLTASHEQDLKKYSAKRSEMKSNFEQEKATLIESHRKETQTALDKIAHLEKEFATKSQQVNDASREVDEKTRELVEMRKLLDEANEQVVEYKNISDTIQKMFKVK